MMTTTNLRAVVFACALAACSRGGSSDEAAAGKGGRGGRGAGGGKLEYPVDVMTLQPSKQQYSVNVPGSVDAFQIVQITARVSGAVDNVNFAEGAEVEKDATLATIESDRYRIAVQSAQATLNKATATEKSAELALERRKKAQAESPGVVAGEEIEQKETAVETAKTDIDAAKEALAVAQLNLRDSNVRSPVKGVVQSRTVQQGEFLQPGAVLATILQRDPMLLRAQVNEDDAPRLHAGMVANVVLREAKEQYTVHLTLVAGAADPTTRLVPITGQFDKSEHVFRLRPGAFCEVSIPIDAPREAIIVPTLAVAPTDKGEVVWILDPKTNTVHSQIIQTGMHTSDGGVEVTKGVAAGDVMIVRGIEPLVDGAPVKVGSTLTEQQAVQPPPDAGVTAPPVTPIEGSGSSAAAPSSGGSAK
jgi:RND family efflux transporter MFP subunit|nr:efflux RND transporter periplasmic adaptor subunit [Kofleriaceae bacterium]